MFIKNSNEKSMFQKQSQKKSTHTWIQQRHLAGLHMRRTGQRGRGGAERGFSPRGRRSSKRAWVRR